MSDSVQPHRRKPTRLPHPWDSPGKNTGVGCHFLLQCMKVKSESEVTQSCLTLSDVMDCSLPGSSIHGIFQARVLEWGAIAFSRSNSYSLLKQNCPVNIQQLRFNIHIFMSIIRLYYKIMKYWKEQECLVYIEIYFQCSYLCLNVLKILFWVHRYF